jgi:hypothetical protein
MRAWALLFVLLAFFTQGWLWMLPMPRPPLDWAALVVGLAALAALALDLLLRGRVRDLPALLGTAGLLAIVYTCAVDPAVLALRETDGTAVNTFMRLLVWGMGLETAAAFLAIGVFVLALRDRGPAAWAAGVPVAVAAGLVWGGWAQGIAARRFPEAGVPAFPALWLAGTAVLAVCVFLLVRGFGRPASPDHPVALAPLGAPRLAVLVGVLAALVAYRAAANPALAAVWPFALAAVLLTGALVVLRAHAKPGAFTDGPFGGRRRARGLAVLVAAFGAAGAVGWVAVPPGEMLILLNDGYTLFGFAWLPLTALAIGARAFARLVSAGRL